MEGLLENIRFLEAENAALTKLVAELRVYRSYNEIPLALKL
jgi:hypothetical protein